MTIRLYVSRLDLFTTWSCASSNSFFLIRDSPEAEGHVALQECVSQIISLS